MLVNDREEIRYQDVSPQHPALWMQIKQFREVRTVSASFKTFPYLIERKVDSKLDPTSLDTHNLVWPFQG